MIVRRRDIIPISGMGYVAEHCEPWDSPCVERNMARSVAEQQQAINDSAAAVVDQCERNANMNPEPYRTQMLSECGRREAISLQQPTAAQAATDYTNAWAAQAEQVRQELLRAGQAFIPENVKPGGYIAPTPVPTIPAAPKAVINSSGGQSAPLTLDAAAVVAKANAATGLSPPWWAWAGGAAVALFFLKGGR